MSQTTEEIKSKLDLYIDDMDKVLDEGDVIRQELIQDMLKLKNQIMDPNCSVDPEFHMARMATFGELRQALNDRDKGRAKKVDVQMKKKSEETNTAIGKIAVEALKNLSSMGVHPNMNRNDGTIVVPDDEETEQQLAKTFEAHGIKVKPTEIRDNHLDLSADEEKE